MDEHIILAADDGFGNVSICPGGVVHVNLQHLSLKFMPSDFAKFCDLIGRAKISFDQRTVPGRGKPRLQLVSPESEKDGEDEREE